MENILLWIWFIFSVILTIITAFFGIRFWREGNKVWTNDATYAILCWFTALSLNIIPIVSLGYSIIFLFF